MLNVIIIEDERCVREELIHALHSVAPDANIIKTITTVKQGIEYMNTAPKADIIFSDVHLGDGLSFEIFQHGAKNIPVIFITGFDEFMLTAFSHNAIDYLLKPVTVKELDTALNKYRSLEQHFTGSSSVQRLNTYITGKKKTRMLVRKGLENIVLKLEEVVLIYTENKVVYAIDKNSRKYIVDNNLCDLEEELDEQVFFRANRQYIINMNFIKGYKSYEKVKLQVDLTLPELNHVIIVSQETAPDFRRWMYEA